MLVFKELLWTNTFSYGSNNRIKLNENPLTQLVGTNGAGKTSISLMLQEVLYGKNIKNIKKQDIANNKSGEKGYYIMLTFEKDGDEYMVELDRKSSLKLRLFKNNKDISSHTSLNTYKTISDIIGIPDFKVFCQLIYQHSTDSLDFLTATDTNRKKFLISLLKLDKYIEYHELFKEKARVLQTDINKDTGTVSTIRSWIENHENMDFVKQNLIQIEPINPEWYLRKSKYQENISNINSINRKISTNNQYKKDLANLDSKYYLGSAPKPPDESVSELRTQVRIYDSKIQQHQAKINKLEKISGTCPECLQDVDETRNSAMLEAEKHLLHLAKQEVQVLKLKIEENQKLETEIKRYTTEKTKFEELNRLIDHTLDSVTLDLEDLKTKLKDISSLIESAEILQKSNEKENLKIAAHNSKVDVVIAQLDKMRKDLKEKNIELMEKENLNDIVELLKKTFGTNGLVSYKIESSVKELEKKINENLAELTYFQIYFKLSGEKLNIEIHDDVGNIFSISNLSSGERARVNVATVLAIRSILSSLTATKINFLMLDEVINSIDEPGREKLSEILLKEKLNTFIVSHGWQHPLIPKINIIKEHDISRIEYD